MAPGAENKNDSDDNNDDSVDTNVEGLAKNRGRRQKIDKKGRLSALERLKKAKEGGLKNKYEENEEGNIYDIVEETEYSKIVQSRLEDDWIVDDDGSGYVEDGREIFDDDLNEEAPTANKNRKKEDKKKNPNIVRPGTKPKTNIKTMFMAQAATGGSKKKTQDVSVANDDLLGDLMEELNNGPNIAPVPIKLKKKAPAGKAANPFNTAPKSIPNQKKPVLQPTIIKQEPTTDYSVKLLKKQKVGVQPQIKTEMLENDNYDEVDGMDVQSVQESLKSEDAAEMMDLGGVDFSDDVVEETQTKPVIKQESALTSIKPKKELQLFEDNVWNMDEAVDQTEMTADVHVDCSQLPLIEDDKGQKVMRFYWLDAHEDPYNNPGTVFLFGKVWVESAKSHVSCCVTVKNIERRLFVLPRATRYCMKAKEDTGFDVSFPDVYEEFNKLAEKHKISKFKTRKTTKLYAFEKSEVPVESEYLEIRYSAEFPSLPSDITGETFSHIFGTHTSSLELLLLDAKMKGPCWLDIKFPQVSNPPISWCKLEVTVQKPDSLCVTSNQPGSTPPLVVMALGLRTLPNLKTHQNEIIGVACLVNNGVNMDKPAPLVQFNQHFFALSKPSDCIFPFDFKDKAQKESKNMKIDVLHNERALLGLLLAKIHKIDPDVIVGHDIFGFDLDVLLHRINANKIPHWSKIGRLKRTKMPRQVSGRSGMVDKSTACGRIVCDVKISAKELIRSRSYDLTELVHVILNQPRHELDYDQVRNSYQTSPHLLQLVRMSLGDASQVLKIMFELNVLPLALQITNICGNVLSRTLLGGRSERNEFLLLHAFTEKNFIVPDKEYKKKQPQVDFDEDYEGDGGGGKQKTQGRRKPAYAGGLVLEPKKGFYDKYILLLDFNSLYPSIIQEYNICFTTVSRSSVMKSSEDGDEEGLLVELPDQDLEPGILPTEIRKLVQSRLQVKQLMKGEISKEQYMQYDIRQKALKLTANSMYGCLGFTFSRFYAKPLAALITGKGREILMKTKDLVQSMNLDVIYGDTDSIMINTNSIDREQVFKLGNKIKAEVNKLYKLLEIDIDGVFKSMLLLKKKKYAALSESKGPDGNYVTQKELKGLDIVRRDWCELAKDAGNYVIDQILSGEMCEVVVDNIHTKLNEIGESVKGDLYDREKYIITKNLTKNPEDYPDKKSLPHVQVALRYNTRGGKKLRAGDTVPYIVCEDGSSLPASQRAYHSEELDKNENLKIDTKYYLANQVHPVVARLCDPIEGTDAAHIAECLGLDPSGYRHAIRAQVDDDDDALLGGTEMSDEEKYKDCDRFVIKCPNQACKREIILDSVFVGAEQEIECSLSRCPNPQCPSRPIDYVNRICNQLVLEIRKHTNNYYKGWLKCEDVTCAYVTRRLPLVFQRGHPVCSTCCRSTMALMYNESSLYKQLCFYQHIFDYEKARSQLSDKEKEFVNRYQEEFFSKYTQLKDIATCYLQQNAYSDVNLGRLFEGMFLKVE